MNIQLINYNGKNNCEFKVERVCSFTNVRSLDMFELNVIDLRNEWIWENKKPEESYTHISLISDFKSIKTMINRSSKTKLLFLLPQNVNFRTYYTKKANNIFISPSENYVTEKRLKDLLSDLSNILLEILPIYFLTISYEPTITDINHDTVEADFYFDVKEKSLEKALLSNKSEKLTAYLRGRYAFCTLDIKDNNQLYHLCRYFDLIEENVDAAPKWFKEIEMFDDNMQKNHIKEREKLINLYKEEIAKAESKLEANDHYKSVLYTSGKELENIVIEIMEYLLETSLEGFIDERNEDFLFKVEDIIFIGEVKGVNHNIKSSNLSQLDRHYLEYIEKKQVDESNVFKLLIMNHQKGKRPGDREEVHIKQINDAKEKYGILIIETLELLKMYEMKVKGDIDAKGCINKLKTKGILKL